MEISKPIVLPKVKRPIVIIGAGGIIGDAHLPAYSKAGFEVRAIYDLDIEKAEKLARFFKIPIVCKDLSELITIAIEGKCVFDMALPASSIMEVLPQLPDYSGVLIQKPMGEDILQARSILDLCRKKKLVAGVNFQLRHASFIRAAKEIIDQGLIGELHDLDVRMNVLTPWHLWDFLYKLPRMEILYNSIHYVDMIRYFLGDPLRVLAKTTKHPNMKELVNTRSSIIMDYGELIRANINTNHGHNFGVKHQESYFKFEGTEGAIKIVVGLNLNYPEGVPDEFEFISLKDGKGWRKLRMEGSWFPDAFVGPMAGLMCTMENSNYKFINSVEDAIYTMDVVEKCYLSSDDVQKDFS